MPRLLSVPLLFRPATAASPSGPPVVVTPPEFQGKAAVEILIDSAGDGFTSPTVETNAPTRVPSNFEHFLACAIRAAGAHRVQLEAAGRLTPTDGAVVVWLAPDRDHDDAAQAASGHLVDWQTDGANRIRLYHDKAAGQVKLQRVGSSTGTAAAAATWSAGDALVVLGGWSGAELQVAVNGGAIATVAHANPPATLPVDLDVGRDLAGAAYFDGALAAVALFSRALTAEEWGVLAELARPPLFGEGVPLGVMTALWYGEQQVYFDDAADQVNHDVREYAWTRGRAFGTQATARSTPGRFTARLRNSDGRYSPSNEASPLYGLLLPGRELRVRLADLERHYDRWTGRLSASPKPVYGGGGSYSATLEAVGPLAELAESDDLNLETQIAIRTGEALELVLDAYGWPASRRSIDAGQTTMAAWWIQRKNALGAMRELEDTEYGFIRERGDGAIVFEDRHARLTGEHLVSQLTLSADVGAAQHLGFIDQADPLTEVFNDVSVEVAAYQVEGAVQTLWEYIGPAPTVVPGETRYFVATWPPRGTPEGARVGSWTTPDGTDVVASGGSVSVAVTKYAMAMQIRVTNTGSTTATLTTLRARGTPIVYADAAVVRSQDEASQAKYGRRRWGASPRWLPDTEEAQHYADFVTARHGEPVAVVSRTSRATLSAAHLSALLARDVSDRVTLDASATMFGFLGDFYIESISERMVAPGAAHDITLVCSSAEGDGGWWVLGSGLLGLDTVLVW